jgi:hypothetical protein
MFDKLLKLSLLTIFMVLGLLIPSNAIAETAKDEDMFDRPIEWQYCSVKDNCRLGVALA